MFKCHQNHHLDIGCTFTMQTNNIIMQKNEVFFIFNTDKSSLTRMGWLLYLEALYSHRGLVPASSENYIPQLRQLYYRIQCPQAWGLVLLRLQSN